MLQTRSKFLHPNTVCNKCRWGLFWALYIPILKKKHIFYYPRINISWSWVLYYSETLLTLSNFPLVVCRTQTHLFRFARVTPTKDLKASSTSSNHTITVVKLPLKIQLWHHCYHRIKVNMYKSSFSGRMSNRQPQT